MERLESPYLRERQGCDRWRIKSLYYDEARLRSEVVLTSYYTPSTDVEGFHLSQITALEILSQLKVIFLQLLDERTEKSDEAWIIDTNIRCYKPIRNHEKIQVHMNLTSLRRMLGRVWIKTESIIFDENGKFSATMKGVLG